MKYIEALQDIETRAKRIATGKWDTLLRAKKDPEELSLLASELLCELERIYGIAHIQTIKYKPVQYEVIGWK